jgi:hypothetical protein
MSSCPKADLRLDWCSPDAAKYACEHWHYSGTVPANRSARVGVWESGTFVGAVIFGLGASPSLGSQFGARKFEAAELTRVALGTHECAVSRILRITCRMVSKANPGLRLIVSFADPFREHHGGIYQAAGWVYTGTTSPSGIWKLADGSWADPRRFNGHGHNAPKAIPRGAELVRTPGKHRYLMPLDDEMRRRIAPLAKPYPKRVRSAENGTAGTTSGGRCDSDPDAPTASTA